MRRYIFATAILGLIAFGALKAAAQDIDSVVSSKTRSPATIADQISDPTERAAFLDLYRPQAPQEMLAKAQHFLVKFPESAFLAQAYEVAGRGSFDLGQLPEGLRYAGESLRFLPENPLLLVSVADVESQQKMNEQAISDGRKAIEFLDRFNHPVTVQEKDWPSLKGKLKASAYFAIGRALLSEALDSPGKEGRIGKAEESEAALTRATTLNPTDKEIEYLLALAELTSNQTDVAAADFASIYHAGGDLAPKAMDNLKAIYKAKPSPKPQISTSTF